MSPEYCVSYLSLSTKGLRAFRVWPGREPVEKSTLRKYKEHAEIIKEIIGRTVLLNTLTPSRCDEVRDELLKKYSRRYAKKILTSFKSILSQARSDERMLHDPAENTAIYQSGNS